VAAEDLADTVDDRARQAEVALALDELHRLEAAHGADQLAHLLSPTMKQQRRARRR
jgi:hypothetical protein